MHETDAPANAGSNDGLGMVQDRAAFEILVLQLTGRDMAYHDRNGTTGLDTAWLCYRAGVAAASDVALSAQRDAEALEMSHGEVIARLRAALREVLEFQSAPTIPTIHDWGRWRRAADGTRA